MLSQTAEHAIRAMIYLARSNGSRYVSAQNIAVALGAPVNYMSKTLHLLAKNGLVTATRGPGGGFRLAVPAASITLDDVIEVFDEARTHERCLLGGTTCSSETPCAAHRKWGAVRDSTRAAYRSTTIADLVTA
jgi:Rrf2 family protein